MLEASQAYDQTHLLILAQSSLSLDHSTCSFSNCLSLGDTCRVRCELRDSNGYPLYETEDSLLLVQSVTNVLRLSDSSHSLQTQEEFVNYRNGTFEVETILTVAGSMLLRVQSQDTGEYLVDSFQQVLSPLEADFSRSVVATTLPKEWMLSKTLHLEVVLVDRFLNILCDPEDTYAATMVVSKTSHYSIVVRSVPMTSDGSCSSESSLYSYRLDYQFMEHGETSISIVFTQQHTGKSATLVNDIQMDVLSDICSQQNPDDFQCWKLPDSSELESRTFSYTCVDSADDCAVENACTATESSCWGNRLLIPRCTSALEPISQCPCITSQCLSGQCFDSPSQSFLCPSLM